MDIKPNILGTIGKTRLVARENNLFAKLELENPGGMKDRPVLHIIQEAERYGLLKPEMTIVESSSGTFARDLAIVPLYRAEPVSTPQIHNMQAISMFQGGI